MRTLNTTKIAKNKANLMESRRAGLLARVKTIAEGKKISLQELLVDQAIYGLQRKLPQFSAASVLSRSQIFVFCLFLLAIAIILLWNAKWMIIISGVVLSCLYLGCVGLRLAILPSFEPVKSPMTIELTGLLNDPQRCGTYSVLVALYREGSQVPELVRALTELKWPKDQSEILLVCEADDDETLGQLAKLTLPSHFRIIRVPPLGPRTKPKALNYALTTACGDFLVIYDAEDRPHPFQLLEARLAFEADELAQTGNWLACLQAPLLIHNFRGSWITRLFEIEYATLFQGILPTLARWQAPLPLGGTSNHFRTPILKRVGGWDPFNVTEDADLGIRLYRAGYDCATITLPTMEEAPGKLVNWMPQRTRWMKGWMQTVLVHLRSPVACMRQMGFVGSFCFIFLLLAIVVSALIHPFFMFISIIYLPQLVFPADNPATVLIHYVCLYNLVFGYLGYILLAVMVSRHRKCASSNWWLLALPLYWLLISFAAWRALFQLFTNPHLWEKTDHVLGSGMN